MQSADQPSWLLSLRVLASMIIMAKAKRSLRLIEKDMFKLQVWHQQIHLADKHSIYIRGTYKQFLAFQREIDRQKGIKATKYQGICLRFGTLKLICQKSQMRLVRQEDDVEGFLQFVTPKVFLDLRGLFCLPSKVASFSSRHVPLLILKSYSGLLEDFLNILWLRARKLLGTARRPEGFFEGGKNGHQKRNGVLTKHRQNFFSFCFSSIPLRIYPCSSLQRGQIVARIEAQTNTKYKQNELNNYYGKVKNRNRSQASTV